MEKKYIIGIDIGGTTVKYGLFEADGTLLEKWETKTDSSLSGEQMMEQIKCSVEQMLEKRCLTAEEVKGIGMGVPGSVNDEGVVIHAPNIGWEMFPAADVLNAKINLPVIIENDANVAALGELAAGSAKGKQSMVFITLGTGVGGAVVVDGKLLRGFHGGAGELGHMCVNPAEKEPCNCGKFGCLEQYTSATGIARLAREYMEATEPEIEADLKSKLYEYKNVTAKEVFDCVKAGDALAIKIAEEFGRLLGNALAQVASVIDPEIFVIGGGVSKAGDILLTYVQKYYEVNAFTPVKKTEFAIASLENDAGIYGGMYLNLI